MNATKPSNTVPKGGAPATKPAVTQIDPAKKTGRPKHPLVGSADKAVYPFKTLPADYDATKYQSLKKKDFTDDEVGFFEYRALLCDNQANAFRAKAAEAKIGGGKPKEEQKLLKKMVREAAKLKELQAILVGKGYDPAKLIADANAAVAKAVAATPVAAAATTAPAAG